MVSAGIAGGLEETLLELISGTYQHPGIALTSIFFLLQQGSLGRTSNSDIFGLAHFDLPL